MAGQRHAERNAQAQARLRGAIPAIFPKPVLVHALARTWVPHLPRLAVASYWAAHPVRADRLARALAARSGAPAGWSWAAGSGPALFRAPPAPFREDAFGRGPGHSCICGQPVFRLGWHVDLWSAGTPNRRSRWHAACVAAWNVWTVPGGHVRLLARLQKRRCAVSIERLTRDAEADHRVPLHQVWRRRDAIGWPALLDYWGFPNLQAVNPAAHRLKSAAEAGQRAVFRRARLPEPGGLGEAPD